jgi:hypothetical protein
MILSMQVRLWRFENPLIGILTYEACIVAYGPGTYSTDSSRHYIVHRGTVEERSYY